MALNTNHAGHHLILVLSGVLPGMILRAPGARLFVPMAARDDGNGPQEAVAGIGHGDENPAANRLGVPGGVPVDSHALVARDGGGSGPLII